MVDLILGDRVLDLGLVTLDTEATHIYVCSAQPTNFADATTNLGTSTGVALGNKSFGAGAVFASPAAGSPGRTVTSVAVSGGTITASGTVAYWAVTDNINARLLATGALTGGVAVTAGQSFTLGSFIVKMLGEEGVTGGYAGPGDIPGLTGAIVWWGGRAYSLATCGTPSILVNRLDLTTHVVNSLADGTLDTTDMDAFIAGGTGGPGRIAGIYDQSGALAGAGATAMDLDINVGGYVNPSTSGSKFAIDPVGGGGLQSTHSLAAGYSVPFTCMAYVFRSSGAQSTISSNDGGTIQALFHSTSNNVSMYQGGAATPAVAASDGAWHSVCWVFNGSSSKIGVDGATPTTVSTDSSGGLTTSVFQFPGVVGGAITGFVRECGWWAGDKSAYFAAMASQQATFWA